MPREPGVYQFVRHFYVEALNAENAQAVAHEQQMKEQAQAAQLQRGENKVRKKPKTLRVKLRRAPPLRSTGRAPFGFAPRHIKGFLAQHECKWMLKNIEAQDDDPIVASAPR